MNAVPLAALATGFVGSLHCLAMCGGPVAWITAGPTGSGANERAASPTRVATFHVGRLASYGVAGAFAGGVAESVRRAVPSWTGIALHLAFVIGLVLAAAEMSGMTRRSGRRTGAPGAWSGLVAKALGRVVRAPSARTTFTLGIVWALVPCGLLYSALSMAASAGTVPGGIATMVAFGLGTTPALLGSTVVARSLTARLHARARRGAALVLVAAALVELGSLVPTGRALAGPSASARAPSHCPHHPGMH